MPPSAAVRRYLAAQGLQVLTFAEPTPTARSSAQAIGCQLGEIAKTMVLLVGEAPVVVVAGGDQKVVSSRLKQVLNASGRVRMPDAEQLATLAGYAPGGVSPFLLPAALPVLLDVSLQRFSHIYPAAGCARSAVAIPPARLAELCRGRWVEVCTPVSP